ncbi:MAG: hypothetical protein TYPL_1220 [Candidatus Tyloplasma litorale]|nr:MAG: hypothetical protein TYPL_1220 [Mycoplasmatales bacterium]
MKNYEELSSKIAKEKNKLIELRKKIIEKIKKENEENKNKTQISSKEKEEIIKNLGKNSYISTKIFPNDQIKKEDVEFSKNLIKEGFETIDNAYDILKSNLSDEFIEDIAEEMLRSHNSLEKEEKIQNYYEETFSNENKFIEEVKDSLVKETDNIINNEIKSEIVIDSLKQEVTVEEHINLPNLKKEKE